MANDFVTASRASRCCRRRRRAGTGGECAESAARESSTETPATTTEKRSPTPPPLPHTAHTPHTRTRTRSPHTHTNQRPCPSTPSRSIPPLTTPRVHAATAGVCDRATLATTTRTPRTAPDSPHARAKKSRGRGAQEGSNGGGTAGWLPQRPSPILYLTQPQGPPRATPPPTGGRRRPSSRSDRAQHARLNLALQAARLPHARPAHAHRSRRHVHHHIHHTGGGRGHGNVVRLLRPPDAEPTPSGPTRRLLRGRLATGPAQHCSRSTNTYATARDLAHARRRGGGGGAEISQTARGGRAARRVTRASTTSGEGPADVKSRSSPRVRAALGTWR